MNSPATKSRTMRLHVWGPNACFTRPEMKVERVSYDVMTPSAARGVLEAILWKPAIRWVVERIDVLKPIRWESVRRNEVGSRMSPRSDGLFIEDQRQQRAGLFLREVDYVIHAHFDLTGKVGSDDGTIKYQEMFIRRAGEGQCFHRPYFGCREFAADFALVPHDQPLPERAPGTPDLGFGAPRDLGWMLYDLFHDNAADVENRHFCGDGCLPGFFRGEIKDGIMLVPPPDSPEVRR